MLGNDPDLLGLTRKIDEMKGEEFEDFLATCFKRIGYHVEQTPRTNDFGADLILIKERKKLLFRLNAMQKMSVAPPYKKSLPLGLTTGQPWAWWLRIVVTPPVPKN